MQAGQCFQWTSSANMFFVSSRIPALPLRAEVYMLTGDNQRTAHAVARQVGIKPENVVAEVGGPNDHSFMGLNVSRCFRWFWMKFWCLKMIADYGVSRIWDLSGSSLTVEEDGAFVSSDVSEFERFRFTSAPFFKGAGGL